MPGYIAEVLQRFAPSHTNGANSPAVYIPPHYGIGIQTPTVDTSTPLSPTQTTSLQELVGSLLYYARGVDVTILPAVTRLSSPQAHPTQDVLQASHRLLAYCSRFPNNALRYHACDMTLHIQSDASYLPRPHARSVAGAIFYLGNVNQPTHINGSIHSLSTIVIRTPSIPGIPGSGTNVRTVWIEDDPIHTICCMISAVLICKLITLLSFSIVPPSLHLCPPPSGFPFHQGLSETTVSLLGIS